jgi:opacity protein-like surface antigen
MRISTLALAAAFAIPATTAAQSSLAVEVRPTFAIPIGKRAGAELTLGPAFGAAVSLRVQEQLHLYAGWDWAHFGAENSFAGSDLDFEETGYAFGLRLERPCPKGHRMALRAELGGTYKHVEIENSAGDLIADSKHSVGYEAALGAVMNLSDEWKLGPAARYRSLSPDFTIGGTKTSGELRYVTLELTLSRSFR